MPAIRSAGQLVSVSHPGVPFAGNNAGWLNLYGSTLTDYATIYKTQPNVRTCVDFLSRNVAGLGLKWYRRTSDTDREYLRNHPAAKLLNKPNQWTTSYRWKEAMVSDLAIYDSMLWVKVPNLDGDGPIALLRVPPQYFEVLGNWTKLQGFRLFGRDEFTYTPEECVYIHGYNPTENQLGLSPMESLRRILAEDSAASEQREAFWRNHARVAGVLSTDAKLTQEASDRMASDWRAMYSGAQNAGKTVVLEQGVKFQTMAATAEQSEYIPARRLNREEVAAAFFIPPSMVGILEHANFANMREQHLMLYTDTLGPLLIMLQQEFERQLLPEFDDTEDVYSEFNLAEKLKGSFEEQATILSTATGRPYMTTNEARARLNLPAMPEGDELVTPMNVTEGGQASPRDAGAQNVGLDNDEREAAKSLEVKAASTRRNIHVEKHVESLRAFFERQRDTALSQHGAGPGVKLLNKEREDAKLATLLHGLAQLTTADYADRTARALGSEYDDALVKNYLAKGAEAAASAINAATLLDIEQALMAEDTAAALKAAFVVAANGRTDMLATSRVTHLSNFGSTEAAKQAGRGTKTWQVNSAKSRHPHLDGERALINEPFSNGLMWPGDPDGSADETAGCSCSVSFGEA